ncbi:MAG: ABC transporter ATP-binding protein, partial [Flavobacteriaceae bacterium]
QIASEGTTILLASHLLDEVEKVCTHVVILQKGKSLYSGRVEDMIASHGFFTLQSDDLEKLKLVLETHDSFGNIKQEDGKLIAYLKEPLDSAGLNKLLFEKGINLSYLVHRKESLEEQFLELTKTA